MIDKITDPESMHVKLYNQFDNLFEGCPEYTSYDIIVTYLGHLIVKMCNKQEEKSLRIVEGFNKNLRSVVLDVLYEEN